MSKIKFGTDGWRDIIAENFTFPNVRLVARAIAEYVKDSYSDDRPVVIGYDTRFLARDFATTVAEVLEGAGIKALLSKRDVPTPVIAFAARNLNTAGAVMITASHNPPQYCGIKYIPDYAGPATKEITDRIVANVERLQKEGNQGEEGHFSIETFDPMPEYLADLRGKVDFEVIRKANLKVVFDPLYGTGRGYADVLLAEAGCQVDSIHAFVDPLFGGGMPEPNPRYLGDLRERILKTGADLGLATDGDADRFGVMDEGGNYFTPNQVIALLLRHLVKNRGAKGSVVRTVATTHLIDRIAAHYGLLVHETPVGFKFVGEWMRKEAVVIGGEESGGLSVLGHIPEKDGILADLLVAEMVAVEGKPLSAIWR
ncbi:MAG TPA: phosphoglucomutase/phosphomannomutase family protein, partial [Chroococcales cyanobacterium]